MEYNGGEVVDAVTIAPEKDLFVNASRIKVNCCDYAVRIGCRSK